MTAASGENTLDVAGSGRKSVENSFHSFDPAPMTVFYRPDHHLIGPGFNDLSVAQINGNVVDSAAGSLIKNQIAALFFRIRNRF